MLDLFGSTSAEIYGGNVHDSVPAIELLKDTNADYILADRGYDSE